MPDAVNVFDASILIVDDQEANVILLELLLNEAGYKNISINMNPSDVCAQHRKQQFDLILLDLQMPGMDGFQVMEALKTNETDPYMPVIVITAQPGHKMRALQAGAKDFISKPFDLLEVKTRIRNVLEVRLLYKLLEVHNMELERILLERTAELRESEARFRSLTELAVDWYWEQDSEGKFIKFSGPVLDMMGIKTSTFQDDQVSEDSNGWDEAKRTLLMGKIAARQAFLDFELTRVNSNGAVHVFKISGQPMFNEKAGFIGYRGIGLEVF